jgi:hypothetical protein
MNCVIVPVAGVIAYLLAFSQPGPTQGKTDFSGRWVLNKAKSKEANPAMFRRRTMEVSQSDAELNVDIRDEEPDGHEFRAYLNFRIDGTPTINILGARQQAVVRWDGAKLIIRWNLDGTPPKTSNSRSGPQGATPPFTWSWSLSPDARELISQIHVYEEKGDLTERLVYARAH